MAKRVGKSPKRSESKGPTKSSARTAGAASNTAERTAAALERLAPPIPAALDFAAADAFVVGSTLTVPLHDLSAGDAVAAVARAGLATNDIRTRRPTLDDVYLRLTGEALAAAA